MRKISLLMMVVILILCAACSSDKPSPRPNGNYADLMGLTVYSFRGDLLTVSAFGLPKGQWTVKIEGEYMSLTGRTKGAKNYSYKYRYEGDVIYLDDVPYYQEKK